MKFKFNFKKSSEPQIVEKPWDKNLQILLASILIFNVVPHVSRVPEWISALSLASVIWKLLYLTRGIPLPRRWLLSFGSVAAAAGVFLSYGTLLGQDPASGLLVVMASLKLLETNRYRDAMFVVFTSYFLLMAYLLDSQSLLATLYLVADVALITLLMFQIHRRDRRRGIRSYKPGFKMLIWTLPVWAFLFFAFPRFTTGLWNFANNQASSGFSDNMNPGAIENMVDDDTVAFRVRFGEGTKLSPGSLYWRGSILTKGDGLRWEKASEQLVLADRILQTKPGKLNTYSLWLEPGFERWLFVLDYPSDITTDDPRFRMQIRKAGGLTYELTRPLKSMKTFDGESTLEAPRQVLPRVARAELLSIPVLNDPRIEALAEKLRAEGNGEPEKIANAVMLYFARSGFHYTKSPGVLTGETGGDQLSQFLFERKRGFCEHYSGAFATLMRLAGVPTRVVIGFQGAKPNAYADYWVVRKMDAHAWNEIWVDDEEGQGHWVRVDPTESVAPLRVQMGGDFNRLDAESITGGYSQDELQRRLSSGLRGLREKLEAFWDSVQMRWNTFLINYDLEYQLDLLSKVGFEKAAPIALAIVSVCGLLVFAIGLTWALRRQAKHVDPVLSEWRRFCERLEAVGITKVPSEGPLDFAERAARANPLMGDRIRELAQSYVQLRYSPLTESEMKEQFKSFRQSARELSIKESSPPTAS